MEENRYAFKVLVRKCDRCRLNNNIKVNLKEGEWENVECIYLA
jgi:hypothetical protein